MQIIQDVYQVAGAAYGENSNVYAIDTGEGIVLIDSGYDLLQMSTIKESLKNWNLGSKPITHVFITHSHFDHTGNAHFFENEGSILHAGNEDAQAMMNGDERTIGFAFRGKVFPKCKEVKPVTDGEIFRIGNCSIECFCVPGHSMGTVIYRIRKNDKYVMFVGDYVLIKGNCEDAILGWNGGPDYNEAEYLKSIRRTKDIEADILLCGHGLPCMRNGSDILNLLYKEALVNFKR